MKRLVVVVSVLIVFGLGVSTGLVLAKKKKGDPRLDPAVYTSGSPEGAAQALADRAAEMAGDGSWENIRVARVLYLGVDRQRGAEILARYASAAKPDASDLIRVGRVYREAGDWEKAKDAFDTVISMEPRDEDWLAEIGAYYNLQGDRGMAEELFQRSFDVEVKLKNLVKAAGSYAGVPPE